ncbi:MAG: efflux transporter periplasmic adaptor subunit, partial [Mesorhizobium sp.]
MSSWKQIVLALVIVVAAAAAWARFYPGAPEVLARWGMDWAIAA